MEIERVRQNGKSALWAYEWDMSSSPARKVNRQFVGMEQSLRSAEENEAVAAEAICWSASSIGQRDAFRRHKVQVAPD